MTVDVKVVKADVLVIGCGLAGLCAAIEAARYGASVVIASKAPPGYGSCTLYSGGAFRAAFGNYTPERHFIETLLHGHLLNDQEMVRTMVMEAPKLVAGLREYGVELSIAEGGAYARGKPPAGGEAIVAPLLDRAEEMGVRVLDRAVALDLLSTGEGVHGCLFYSIRDGRLVKVLSGAVVLATGGYAGLYARSDNPRGIVGDGCAMALRAGARLIDMEFVQFFPLGLAEPGKPVWLVPFTRGRLVNRLGEDVLKRYGLREGLEELAVKRRDLLSRVMWLEVSEGRGFDGSLMLVLEEEGGGEGAAETVLSRIASGVARVLGLGDRIRVAPLAHFTMGGVRTTTWCHAGLAGLFACGEVVGGVHGANRLGGNALTEAVVFGTRAGEAAAIHSRHAEPGDAPEVVEDWARRLRGLASGRESPRRVRAEVSRLMWEKCGVVREGRGLRDLLSRLRELEAACEELGARGPRGVVEAVEASNAVLVAAAVALSALARRESRGAHYRLDCPRRDDSAWLRRVVVSMERGRLRVSYEPVELKYIEPGHITVPGR